MYNIYNIHIYVWEKILASYFFFEIGEPRFFCPSLTVGSFFFQQLTLELFLFIFFWWCVRLGTPAWYFRLKPGIAWRWWAAASWCIRGRHLVFYSFSRTSALASKYLEWGAISLCALQLRGCKIASWTRYWNKEDLMWACCELLRLQKLL